MTRQRSTAQVAADVDTHRGGALLLELNFDSGTLRLCYGRTNIEVGGHTYYASALGVSVSAQQESAGSTEGLDFSLSGLSPEILALVVNEPWQRKTVRLLEQRYNAVDEPVGDPVVEYVGRITAMPIIETPGSGGTVSIAVSTEQFDAANQHPANLRFTDAEQRRRYPDDAGLEYCAALVDRTLQRKPKV